MAKKRRRSSRQEIPPLEIDGSVSEKSRRATSDKRAVRKALSSGWGIQRMTWEAASILFMAIVTSVLWNQYNESEITHFLKRICQSSATVNCHPGLSAAWGRIIKAVRRIRMHETVLSLPRELTIWDLDAFRDAWIQAELFSAKNKEDGTALDAAAFLAAYLARLLLQLHSTIGNKTPINPILVEYLSTLPTNFSYHPLMWPGAKLTGVLQSTYTSNHVLALRRTVKHEYDAFATVSSEFAQLISWDSYQIARLNVMTRSFGTGKWINNDDDNRDFLINEIEMYKQKTGVDLSHGCHAMVPVLDQLNHHAQPNVGFYFDLNLQAWVISAINDIPAGTEIFDSYGKRTDSDLFAKFGFINGDGSDYTEASVALWHDPEDTYQTDINQRLLRYLQYDDGYESCVEKNDDTAWELKLLKFQHLQSLAHKIKRWNVRMPPRDVSMLPTQQSSKVPEFDLRNLKFDGRGVFSTCRLITLTHHDYEGRAMEMLRTHMYNETFYLPQTEGPLEFRTSMCVARMAQTALSRYGMTVQEQSRRVDNLSRQKLIEGNTDWIVAHILLGEMQTLEALKQKAFAALGKIKKEKFNSEPAYSMRNDPCLPQILFPLLKELP